MPASASRLGDAQLVLEKGQEVTLQDGQREETVQSRHETVSNLLRRMRVEPEDDDMVVLDLDGKVVEGHLKPSSDTPTHLALYKAFPQIGGIVHTHSTYATAWAQAGKDLPCLGTTHADYFHGPVPCTESLSAEQVRGQYELETGNAIIRRFESLNPQFTPGVLVKNHGPFTWGASPALAAYHARVLEEVAQMAFLTLQINPSATGDPLLEEKHFFRKHGPGATYGQ